MPVKKEISEPYGIYFITFTCYNWLPLIEITKGYDIVYKWFDVLINKGSFLLGYTIMPNHIHALLAFRNSQKNINTIIGNGKRFMAYEIVNRLFTYRRYDLLKKLSDAVEPGDKKRGKLHEVWMDSFHWMHCYSADMINQKLNYMHNNPCVKKWQLVKNPIDYLHSSARFYIAGEQGIYTVTNYMEMADIDLSKMI